MDVVGNGGRATASGYLNLGLLSIPVKFFTATQEDKEPLYQVHGKCCGRTQSHVYSSFDALRHTGQTY